MQAQIQPRPCPHAREGLRLFLRVMGGPGSVLSKGVRLSGLIFGKQHWVAVDHRAVRVLVSESASPPGLSIWLGRL